jgi:Domain of unknown function (DUF5348)
MRTITGTLTLSANKGRYAVIDESIEIVDIYNGIHDLASDMRIEICLGQQWIAGTIEHSGGVPPHKGVYAAKDANFAYGYYFVSDTGKICGLCTGMHVRIIRDAGKAC